MDVIKTGVFQISTVYSEFWTEWQEQLAKEDLKRRAKAAMDKIMRDGVPYVTCLYPVKKLGDKLVLTGFCALAQREDCEIDEAYCMSNQQTPVDSLKRFAWGMNPPHNENICIYRRVE